MEKEGEGSEEEIFVDEYGGEESDGEESDRSDEDRWDQLLARVMACAGDSKLEVTREDLKAIFLSQEHIRPSSQEICRRVAESGYTGWSLDVLLRDEAKLREVGSVVALVSARIDEQRGDLISAERIKRQDTSMADPENLARVIEGAEQGFRMPFPVGFVAQPDITPSESKLVRSIYLLYSQLIQEKVERRRAVAFRASLLKEFPCDVLTYSRLHVAEKPGPPWHRPVIHYLSHMGPEIKETCNSDEFFGPQKYAGVGVKIAMFNAGLAEAKRRNCDLVGSHFDLKDAFDRATLVPEEAPSYAYKMNDPVLGEIIIVPLSPQMGSPGAPGAFNRLSQLTLSVVRKATEGLALTECYVDDFVQVSFSGPGPEDKQYEEAADRTEAVMRDLLGPTVVAEKKTVRGSTVIRDCGYVFSIGVKNEECVEFTPERLRKAAAVFFSMEEEHPLGVTLWNRVKAQSHGTCLTYLYPQMKPLLWALYASTKGGIQLSRSTRQVRLIPSKAFIACVWVLQAFFTMLILDNGKHSCRKRLLASFLPRPIIYVIDFDASLTGGGIIFLKLSESTNEFVRFAVAAFPFPFALVHLEVEVTGGALVSQRTLKRRRKRLNSALQNSAEFIVGTVGMALLIERGLRKADVMLRGDSKTALSWAKRGGGVRSQFAFMASMAFVQLTSTAYVQAADTVHVPGEDNGDCDVLSRGGDPSVLFPSLARWPVEGAVAELLRACNPTLPELTSSREIFKAWKQFETLTKEIMVDLPGVDQGGRMELG